jgi:hypothetical protein
MHLRSCPRTAKRGVDLISDVLPFGRLYVWRAEVPLPLSTGSSATLGDGLAAYADG